MTALPADPKQWNVGLIGYGEVGRILAEDLRQQDVRVSAYDIKLRSDQSGRALRDHAKQRASAMIDGAGGRYVEGAVMTSVPPYRIKVPLLLGGGDAATLAPLLVELGFAARVASDKLGVASAVKMCRSVMIKGLEAMVIESFTTARAYGVEDAVLASLAETFPGINWEKQGAYFFQRVIEHGRRRSEEVREVAETVREIGLTPWSARGTAERQAWVADLADQGLFGPKGTKEFARSPDWRTEADRILAKLNRGE